MNISITLDKKLLNDKDIDFFHYNESFELATCEYGCFRITSMGELKGIYRDDEELIAEDNLNIVKKYYVKNNDEYIKAINNGKLYLDLNNWFTIEFFDNNDNFIETNYIDSVYGSLSDCLLGFKEDLENTEFMKELEEQIKIGV